MILTWACLGAGGQALLPVLRASTAAHPRLHTLWPTLLALLLPGYTPAQVR